MNRLAKCPRRHRHDHRHASNATMICRLASIAAAITISLSMLIAIPSMAFIISSSTSRTSDNIYRFDRGYHSPVLFGSTLENDNANHCTHDFASPEMPKTPNSQNNEAIEEAMPSDIIGNDSPIIDSIARRHLVFSLLASSSLVPFAVRAISTAVSATDTDSFEISSSSTSSTTLVGSSGSNNEPIKVLKPPLDKRLYETYTLPNGLKVLLCSDPSSTAAAVGMNVHVGACSDPVEIPGLVSDWSNML